MVPGKYHLPTHRSSGQRESQKWRRARHVAQTGGQNRAFFMDGQLLVQDHDELALDFTESAFDFF